jgi:FKBP-type peptidyl-prolyl cis-trans isomerase FkpA
VRRQLTVLTFLLAVLATACGGSDNPTPAPSNPLPQGPAELTLTDLTVGTGDSLTPSATVIVHYTLWLYDPAGSDSKGTRVGSSRDSNTPYTFKLGTNAVIPGFEQAVQSMKVGGLRRAIVPPSLAYGSTGNNTIPGNAWLVFEIELLAATN